MFSLGQSFWRNRLSGFLLDQISTPAAAAYSTRKLRSAYTGAAMRVRRSSDNAELDIGFATAIQTRTNLTPVPANNLSGFGSVGITMTTIGTGTEFGQSYVDVRFAGTATGISTLVYSHSLGGVLNPGNHAAVTPGLTYTSSVGYRLIAGTAHTGTTGIRTVWRNASGVFVNQSVVVVAAPAAQLQRYAAVGVAPATAAYAQPGMTFAVTTGDVVDFTVRVYSPNVEEGVGNARPLLDRYVPETIAGVGDLDADTLLAFNSSENLLLHSEAFENAYWTKVRSTAVPNALAAPNATMTAGFVRENTEFGAHVLLRSETVVASTLYTFSVYVAKFGALNSRRWAYFSAVTNTGNATRHTILVDLQAGTVIETRQLGSPVGGASSVTDAGNFWRVSVSMRSEGTGFLWIFGAADSATPSWTAANDVNYTGDGVSGVYFWGAQPNLGPVALPYTPTTTTAQTFNINTGTFVPTWYDQSGNGYHATQTTAANQPSIVTAGVVNILNGRTTVSTAGSNTRLDATTVPLNTPYTVNAVANRTSGTSYQRLVTGSTAIRFLMGTLDGSYITTTGNGATWNSIGNTNTPTTAVEATPRVLSAIVLSTGASPFIDGQTQNTRVGSSGNTTGISIFSLSNQHWIGSSPEIVIFPSALSTADRQTLERNQGSYFGITVA